jgi:hypothetical protein
MSAVGPDLLQRLERVEAQLAIQQLPARYALAVDSRDLDALVGLFVDDVPCGRWGNGREALKSFYASDPILRGFYRSQHQVCGQTVDLIDADHASGTVYCRAEHEDGPHWVVMAICYFDRYERRDGRWFFARRDEQHWYSTDWNDKPRGPNFQNWPGRYTGERHAPRLPHSFASWQDFWAETDPALLQAITKAP